jgi:hypothetical protein
MPVILLNERFRYLHLPAPGNALLAKAGLVGELARRDPKAKLSRRFNSVESFGTLTPSHNGVSLQSYVVYRVSQPRQNVTSMN